ncbi:Gfo/Idh/MocA family protein [Oricola cellulosilytica]|uniref:Gfo/Idh/MocA family oxidoreductase n=1 Tax=Oricola cellulosilytica TaxID=1429082 RepID=A0A4R0PCQ0_9HYPH|nr:Gfo/Idh/MocA family oxidoreductase [Oricola cellulosilytica]TCD15250.1 Gfo/Idh/MocA family oxidoreductase [Oricola cellulosilytica]
MHIALVGTGFVADYYMTTLANHRELSLAGVWDRDAEQLQRFVRFHSVPAYNSLDALLADDSVETVVNLTHPQSHFAVSVAALEAGKHVYSEKPLAMTLGEARELTARARKSGRIFASAPANHLSAAFQLTAATLSSGAIGSPRLVYAEMEDGAVFRENWQSWRSKSGASWPGAHEFEIGCTLEHAGYCLSWLIALFGGISRIIGYSGVMFADKGVPLAKEAMGADFSTAVLEFENGVVARLTNGLAAPRDRSLTVMGDAGTLTVEDLWNDRSAVRIDKAGDVPSLPSRLLRRIERAAGSRLPLQLNSGHALRYGPNVRRKRLPAYPSRIDFAAGLKAVSDCAAGSGKGRNRLSNEALHLTEAALALDRLGEQDGRYEMTTSLADD